MPTHASQRGCLTPAGQTRKSGNLRHSRASPGQDLAGPGLQAEEAVPIPISAAAMCLELADACARLELARGADAEMPLMPARPAGLPGPP